MPLPERHIRRNRPGHYSPGSFGFRARGGAKARRCTFEGGARVRTDVYIDGFNLYYGLLRSGPFKWLDLEQLLPKNDVRRICYFTAKVDARPHNPGQPVSQLAYLRALATLPRVETHFGNFIVSVVRQPLVETDPVNPRR